MDNIWSSRFWNAQRTPAWHGMGINSVEPVSAQYAYDQIGAYDVKLLPLVARTGANGRSAGLDTAYSIIVREATEDDPQQRVFGAPVSNEYELITPEKAAKIYDMGVGNINDALPNPVETLGVLGKGEEIFITTKLQSYDIKGDEIDSYLFFYSPMYSGKAAVVGTTQIRVVCANTLRAALRHSTIRQIFVHREGVASRITDWLMQATEQQLQIQETIKQAYEILASTKATVADAEQVLQVAYPDPEEPSAAWVGKFNSTTTLEQFQDNYEKKKAKVKAQHEAILGLWDGDGAGMDLPSVKGTAFGVLNAVSEYETFRRGVQERAVVGLQVGDRGNNILKTFSALNSHFKISSQN